MAEYYVESPQWLNKIPKAVADIGVLLEPMSVVEKGIDHAFLLQRRLEWKPKTGLVLGGGPVGLLAAAVMRARGLDTHVVGREPETRSRAQLVMKMGAKYHSVANKTIFDVKKEIPPIDLADRGDGRRERGVRRDADPRPQRRAVSAQPDRRNEDRRTANRENQSAARARQPGRIRQRQRQPPAFRDGREGLHGHRKEVARRTETAHHDEAAVGSVRQMVRAGEQRD